MPRTVGAAMLGALLVGGCARETVTTLAREVTLDVGVTALSFPAPLTAAPGPRALCFEFERPGDSRSAHDLQVVLEANDGARDTVVADVDRTGEASVCLRDSTRTPRVFRAMTLSAPRRVQVRHLEWRVPAVLP